MSIMNESDTIQVFRENLKIAADRARELGKILKAKPLMSVAYQLDQMLINAMKLWDSKQLDKAAKEAILVAREKDLATDKT